MSISNIKDIENIKRCIGDIYTQNLKDISYEELYRNIYNITLNCVDDVKFAEITRKILNSYIIDNHSRINLQMVMDIYIYAINTKPLIKEVFDEMNKLIDIYEKNYTAYGSNNIIIYI